MYEGFIDQYNGDFIDGWAWDNKHPDTPIVLEILNNGNLVSRVDANRFRIDLYSLKKGNGEHGFFFEIPDSLRDGKDHTIEIRCENTGHRLSGSPVLITTEIQKFNIADVQNNPVSPKSPLVSDPAGEADLQELATKKIRNLGELLDPRYAGIYTVIPDQDVVDLYLHDEFRSSGASNYDKRNTNPAYYIRMMDDLVDRLEAYPFNRNRNFCNDNVKILDIGSGSGNSIFPIIDFFPGSRIIASDLSPDMLLLLKNNLPEDLKCNNLSLMQLNAEDLAFKENSFDIVFGFSILHHLFSPEITLQQCSKVLKNSGLAVFFEPFESGNQLLKNVFEKILSDTRSKSLSPRVVNMLKSQVLFFDVQKGTDKSSSCFKHIEDKWVFSENYLKRIATSNGFIEPVIYNINPSETPLENKVKALEKIASNGTPKDALPDWAWEIVRRYEMNLPEDERRSMLFEGCIILQKN